MTERRDQIRLPATTCRRCGHEVHSEAYCPTDTGRPPAATTYDQCLRRCSQCGLGFSNAASANPDKLTMIYRDPLESLPAELAVGCLDVLARAINVRNRRMKAAKFCSENSEDHVTWTVFRWLQVTGQLRTRLAAAGSYVAEVADNEPMLCLWGAEVPVGNLGGIAVARRLVEVSDLLEERPTGRSEPDVVCDFGEAGCVFVEVKLRSGNDRKPSNYPGWDRYLASSRAFRDGDATRASGMYELARNWRIGFGMVSQRPFELVNLGPNNLDGGGSGVALKSFEASLQTGKGRRFTRMTWEQLLCAAERLPEWLQEYLVGRRVVPHAVVDGPRAVDGGYNARSKAIESGRCAICGASDDRSEEFVRSYPGLVCRDCDARATDATGAPAWDDTESDTGSNPVFIDGVRCRRRYRFGGWVTMREAELG